MAAGGMGRECGCCAPIVMYDTPNAREVRFCDWPLHHDGGHAIEGPVAFESIELVRAAGIAEGRRQVTEVIRAERDNWHRVATVDPPGPMHRERALAKVEVLDELLRNIEAIPAGKDET